MLKLYSWCSGRRHYHGPHAYITEKKAAALVIQVDEGEGEKGKRDGGPLTR